MPTMHTPPECQGQIVTVSYGSDCESYYYRRTEDRSDRTVTWERADMGDAGLEEGDWQPWNREPAIDCWEPCAAPGDALAQAVLAALDDGARTCLQLAAVAPWCDLSGKATRLGVIDATGRLTDLGREVVRLLAEGAGT